MPASQLNNARRIEVLNSYHFQEETESAFNDIARLAIEIFQTPFALITIVDRHRNWTLGSHTFPADTGQLIFCDYGVIDPTSPLIVSDARTDPRFFGDSIVLSEPHIVFYAGAPIIDPNGVPLGFVSIMDTKVREFNAAKLDTLSIFARQSMTLLNLRTSNLALIKSEDNNREQGQKQAQVELALLTSETHFKLLSNTVPAMIFYLDDQQRYRTYNQTFMEWFGVNATEIIGKTVKEFIGEQAYNRVEPHLSIAYNGRQESYEMKAPSRMGTEKWLNIIYTPHISEEGNVLGVIVFSTDITRSKHTENALRESESGFRALIEEAPVATALFVGRSMTVTIANETMLKYWGKNRSVIGMPLADAVPELKGQPFLDILDNVYQTGETFSSQNARAELEVDGVLGIYYFDFTYKPLRNANGEVFAVMDMAIDVTEQALIKQKIEESQRQLLASFEESPVGLAIIGSSDLIFQMANPFFGFLANRKQKELIGKPLLTAVPELAEQGFDDHIRQVMKTGQPYIAKEAPVNIRRGENLNTIYIDYTCQPYRDTSGEITGVLIVVLDITEQVLARRRIEESEVRYRLLSAELEQQVQARTKQLQDSVLDLERSNRDLQQFAYVASHDLQEPLRKVQTLGELLKTRHADKLGDGVEILGRMQSSAARMSLLIHDVLAFSKISSRSESLQPVSLGAIVEQAIADLDLMIQEKRARVIVEPLYDIQGNAFQLGQLFQNLINNALKFNRPDVNPVVQIHAKKILASSLEPSVNPLKSTDEYICVDIRDNGIGFDETFKERIFQVFQRLHGRTEYSGTGIGLAICEKVISNHGGAISVRSTIGQGTTFSLYFPVVSHPDATDNQQ